MKVTIRQCVDLQVEIAGSKSVIPPVIGLLNEKLGFKTKYWLQKMFKKVMAEVNDFSEAEKSIFLSLGATEKNGRLRIPKQLEDGSLNPVHEELEKQRQVLLDETVDLGDFNFKIEEFDFESESRYTTFMAVVFDA